MRLAHNQEVAGARPAAATIFAPVRQWETLCLPSRKPAIKTRQAHQSSERSVVAARNVANVETRIQLPPFAFHCPALLVARMMRLHRIDTDSSSVRGTTPAPLFQRLGIPVPNGETRGRHSRGAPIHAPVFQRKDSGTSPPRCEFNSRQEHQIINKPR